MKDQIEAEIDRIGSGLTLADNTTIYPLFSKPIYTKIIDTDGEEIVSIIKKYEFSNVFSTGWGNKGMKRYLSSASSNKNVLKDEKLRFVKDKLVEEFDLFSSDVMKYTNEFEIITSWFTRCEEGQSSGIHNHNNCLLSGVLYLQTDENSGNIKFQNFDNRRYQMKIEEYNVFNSIEFKLKPEDGLLIFFPSEMWHKIEESKSHNTRYSLAFNLLPVGLVGNDKSDSHMRIKVDR
jgi:uncharacterized protein (TIGR02466 family)